MKTQLAPGLLLLSLLFACAEEQGVANVDETTELRANELPEDLKEPTRILSAPLAPERETMTEIPQLLIEQGVTLDLMNTHLATERAPEKFRVKLVTTKGDIVIECVRDWAPLAADRFYNLVKIDYFRDIYFNYVIDGFIAQFGIHGNTMVSTAWMKARIRDETPKQSNRRGYVTLANNLPRAHTRTTQVFINLKDNPKLDQRGFAPFGRVISGMKVVDSLFAGYGDNFPPSKILDEGNEGARSLFRFADVLHYAEFSDPEDVPSTSGEE